MLSGKAAMRKKAYPRQRFSLTPTQSLNLLHHALKRKTREGEARAQFEKAFAAYLGVPHAMTFSSSRAGIYFCLKNLGLSPGDEVICQSYTFFIVPAMIRLAGLKPVFVDVDPETYNLDPDKVEEALTPRSRVLIVTHLHGVPAPLDPLLALARKHNLRVIEDCAHATGLSYKNRYVGTHDVGCFSLGIGKNLSTVQGGMVTTTDSNLFEQLQREQINFREPSSGSTLGIALNGILSSALTHPRLFRWSVYLALRLQDLLKKDWIDRFMDDPIHLTETVPDSFFTHFSDLQATLGLWRLQELPSVNRRLGQNAKILNECMPDNAFFHPQKTPDEEEGIYMHYTLRTREPSILRSHFLKNGWDTQMDYCCSCADLAPFRNESAACPISKELDGHVIFLPNYPDLPEDEIRNVMRTEFPSDLTA